MSNEKFIKHATKILKKIGVIDLQYSRIDGKPLFKIGIDKIDLLKKYFIIDVVQSLEDIKFTYPTKNYNPENIFLTVTNFSKQQIRKQKLKKCQKYS